MPKKFVIPFISGTVIFTTLITAISLQLNRAAAVDQQRAIPPEEQRSAQEESYLHDTSVVLGFIQRRPQSETMWLRQGYGLCQAITQGTPIRDLLQAGDRDNIEKLTLSAVTNLCPEHKETVFEYRDSRQYWLDREQHTLNQRDNSI